MVEKRRPVSEKNHTSWKQSCIICYSLLYEQNKYILLFFTKICSFISYFTLYSSIIFFISPFRFMLLRYRLYLLAGFPSGATKNFSKFHAISALVTGSQMIFKPEAMNEILSSDGNGSFSFRNLNTGWVFFPLTSHFSMSVNLGLNPFPGLTWVISFLISSGNPFS